MIINLNGENKIVDKKKLKIWKVLSDQIIRKDPVKSSGVELNVLGQDFIPLGLLYYDFYLNYEKPYIKNLFNLAKIKDVSKDDLKNGAIKIFNLYYIANLIN